MNLNRVLVVGDFIIDKFIHYTAIRRSPEADCPVVLEEDTLTFDGGAMNVYRNVKSLGGDARFHTWGSPTTKTRHIVDNKHSFRHDEKSQIPATLGLSDWCKVREKIQWADVVVMSDYGLSTFPNEQTIQTFIQICNRNSKPVLVDPDKRKTDWSIYQGANLIKCNSSEFQAAKNKENFDVVITKGSNGAEAVIGGQTFKSEAFKVREVDVTGCGDVFLATLALLYGSRSDWDYVLHECNLAAAIAVQKPYTAVVTSDEMGWTHSSRDKYQDGSRTV